MSAAPDVPPAFSEADWKFATRLLEKGKSLPEVEDKLLGRGLSPDQTAALLAMFVQQCIYAEAGYLLAEGRTPAAVAAELVKHGLEQVDANRVVDDVQKFHRDQEVYFRYAIEALGAGKSSQVIESELISKGASPELANFILREAGRLFRREVRKVGLKNLGIGVVLLVLGIGITVFTLKAALKHGGTWFIMGGLTISGLVCFFRGLFQLLTGSDT